MFIELNDNQTQVEVYSLSTNAKRVVAKNLFHGLDIEFGYAPPDLEPKPTDTTKSEKVKP